MHLVFLGYPGSGKGTLSKKLATSHKQISTGDLLRLEIASGSSLGVQINEIISKGELVSDDLAIQLIKKNINSIDSFIFDGFPRTLNQAQLLHSEVLANQKYVVVYFKIQKQDLVDRITLRRSCSNQSCGGIFNLKTKPPKQEKECDICGSSLVQRNDDSLESLNKRCSIFDKNGPDILNYFKTESVPVITLNANKPEDLIYKDFLKKYSK